MKDENKSNSASPSIKVGSGAWAELGKMMPPFQHSVLVFDVQSIVDTFDRCSINEVITHIMPSAIQSHQYHLSISLSTRT